MATDANPYQSMLKQIYEDAAYFTSCWPGISHYGGHPFHVMAATDFTAWWPPL